MFTSEDIKQINGHGLSSGIIEDQLENFRNGFPPADLTAAATVGDGIIKLADTELIDKSQFYDRVRKDKKIVKFVPASGAASRMFKNLFAFMESYDGSESAYQKMTGDQSRGSMYEFFKRLDEFAFFEDLKQSYKSSGMALEEAHMKQEYVEILDYVLSKKGLNYGGLPKGLLKFHKYENAVRTPAEEHIVEGCSHAKTGNGEVFLHFTVSPEHLSRFKKHISEVMPAYEAKFAAKLHVEYSVQKPGTDTIAVDLNNDPFREPNGTLLFRPAGHGALLENLNDIDADIIFLKNIDNVLPDRLKDTTIRYKKVLGGVLLEIQQKISEYVHKLEDHPGEDDLASANQFVREELGWKSNDPLSITSLQRVLNRPVRVCGMVKNEGEPGGGPFWVRASDKSVSLQIVESAQIDLENADQSKIMSDSTHFNPVDVVCGVKDSHGNKFDLLRYRDPATGFITQKSKDGKDLKAQELPGLWNGGMAHWNTVFVEVPSITFNPVKTVSDLLKEEHL